MSIKQPTSDLNGLTRFANYALIGGGLPAVLLLVADYVVGFKLVPSNQSRVFIAGIAGLFILYGIKWGIHFTQVTPIFCGLGSRDFGVPIGNDRAIRGWVNGHSLLHQPVEELAAAA